jgi:hypothetical protein
MRDQQTVDLAQALGESSFPRLARSSYFSSLVLSEDDDDSWKATGLTSVEKPKKFSTVDRYSRMPSLPVLRPRLSIRQQKVAIIPKCI